MRESRSPRTPMSGLHRCQWAPRARGRRIILGLRCAVACVATLACLGIDARAQTIEQMTFDEAVRRAVTSHPTIQQAAAGILRAEAVLQQVRSRSLPSVEASFSTNIIDPVARFSGASINPRTQTVTSAAVIVPLLSPVRWAERHQAEDGVLVSRSEEEEARQAVAVAAGEAYLAIIAQRRVLDLSTRARDHAQAHYEFANQRFEGGVGSRLNALRAQQELSGNEARVEDAHLAVRRAQEALGVLVAADGPVDAAGEPVFRVPPAIGEAITGGIAVSGAQATIGGSGLLSQRADVRLLARRQLAAERVANDSWKASLPSVEALFSPTLLAPSGLFANARSWRASVLFSVPLFDSGQRRGQARERQAIVDIARAARLNIERQAASEIRTAREAVAATQRALEYARAAVAQADEVVRITDVAFREGATTNIEVIDAQRVARDAETSAAIAEDAVRRAQLELLVATGQFP
ncbi:MAG: TolC family protein [Acidobacteria bacterium]|nr:TolC family protein [Acidobacteriota bacterium]